MRYSIEHTCICGEKVILVGTKRMCPYNLNDNEVEDRMSNRIQYVGRCSKCDRVYGGKIGCIGFKKDF